jgi:hypothetical protein
MAVRKLIIGTALALCVVASGCNCCPLRCCCPLSWLGSSNRTAYCAPAYPMARPCCSPYMPGPYMGMGPGAPCGMPPYMNPPCGGCPSCGGMPCGGCPSCGCSPCGSCGCESCCESPCCESCEHNCCEHSCGCGDGGCSSCGESHGDCGCSGGGDHGTVVPEPTGASAGVVKPIDFTAQASNR